MQTLTRIVLGSLSALGLALLIALAIGVFVAAREPPIESGSALVLDLEGAYVEAAERGWAGRLQSLAQPGAGPVSMLGLVGELDKAARDERLRAVVLRIRDLEIGWGKAQEIRAAIGRLRARDRRTIALLETEGFGSSLEYYVAAAADAVYAQPGVHAPAGLAVEYVFLGGLWKKLGIEMQVERAGGYKTLADVVAGEDMSQAHREMARSLLDSVHDQYLNGIEGRRVLRGAAREGGFADPALPTESLVHLGLLDGVASLDALVERELDGAPVVHAATYRRVSPQSVGIEPAARVALVYASGPLIAGERGLALPGAPVTASDAIARALEQAAADPDVRAILLRVDSGGGSALASEIAWRAVRRAAQARPVIVSISDAAASGAYYLASAADVVVAHPGSLTGSIGVVSIRPAIGELLSRLDVGHAALTRGEHADLLLGTQALSEASRSALEARLGAVYERFVARVAEGRDLERERVDALAQGRVWTGAQAAERGLVDALGGVRVALTRARRAAGLDPDADVALVPYPRPRGWLPAGAVGFAAGLRGGEEPALRALSALAGRAGIRVPAASALRAARAVAPGAPALVAPVSVEIR